MALNPSGPISLGGSTAGESIALELGLSATGTISLNDTAVRGLAGVASGAIVMPTDFYGKSVSFSLYSWGGNYQNALGLANPYKAGSFTNLSSPIQVGSFTDWIQGSASLRNAMAIRSNGTLWGTGNNPFKFTGINSDPVQGFLQSGALTNWKYVNINPAVSGNFMMAVKTDGTLWGCGRNGDRQLATSDTNDRSSPIQVGTSTDWKYVSCAQTAALAIKTTGSLWGWGNNTLGQLGLGDKTSRSAPTQVGALTNWKQIANSRYSTIAVKTDNTLWAWGDGTGYLFGIPGVFGYRSSPIQIGSLSNWASISIGAAGNTMLAVKTDGTLWGWGRNYKGQLGLGDRTIRNSPVQIGALTNWKQVSCRYATSLAVKTDGTLWAWGWNQTGSLGNISTQDRSSPIQVGSLTSWKGVFTGYINSFGFLS